MSANEDLKELQKSNSEMNVKSEMGYGYKDMYTSGYLEFLSKLCKKYNVEFDESEIDWEWCNYIQNKQWELEKKIKQSPNYKISNKDIIDNMTPNEKFKIVCRIKEFDIDEIGEEIYGIIENSEYEDKREYIDICGYEDESMELTNEYCLSIDSYMLDEVFSNEFTDKQKEFIQLAIECNVKTIVLRWMS